MSFSLSVVPLAAIDGRRRVVLVRGGARTGEVSDAVVALETPHAFLLGPAPALSVRLARLTRREHEVLTEIALGKVNKEIARELGITRPTAQRYVRRVLNKLRVANRTQAARLALLGDRRVNSSNLSDGRATLRILSEPSRPPAVP